MTYLHDHVNASRKNERERDKEKKQSVSMTKVNTKNLDFLSLETKKEVKRGREEVTASLTRRRGLLGEGSG